MLNILVVEDDENLNKFYPGDTSHSHVLFGGTIMLSSMLEHGSTFTVCIKI